MAKSRSSGKKATAPQSKAFIHVGGKGRRVSPTAAIARQSKPLVHVGGKGRKLPLVASPFLTDWTQGPLAKIGMPRPQRRKPVAKTLPFTVGPFTKGPLGKPAIDFLTGPTKRPPRKKKEVKPRWHETLAKPEGFAFRSDTNLPPNVEAFIDLEATNKGIYKLNRAVHGDPDHEVIDQPNQHCICHHPKNASSWVAMIGLVVLQEGRLGLYAAFWNGGEIAYVWPSDDTTIWFYNDWKSARSKGKYIRGREGPSMLWAQPYVRLA